MAANPLQRTLAFWRNPVARWALVLGVLVHLAGFFAFSIAIPPDEPAFPGPPLIYYADSGAPVDPLLAEQAALLDFEPLFLPTPYNAPVRLGGASGVERVEPFPALRPDLLLTRTEFPRLEGELAPPVTTPADVLAQDRGSGFSAFGLSEGVVEPLPARAGCIEVYQPGRPEPLRVEPLDEDLAQEAFESLGGVMEWRLAIGRSGVVGRPLLVRGSGVEAADEVVAGHLAREAPAWGLPAGYYRVVVGP